MQHTQVIYFHFLFREPHVYHDYHIFQGIFMDEKLGEVRVRIVPIEHYAGMAARRASFHPRSRSIKQRLFIIALLFVAVMSSVLLYSGVVVRGKVVHGHGIQQAKNASRTSDPATLVAQTLATNGANQWDEDTQVTAPTFDFPQTTPSTSVAPLFEHYYTTHSGIQSLGVPITAAFPTNQGWIQFFKWGALLSPALTRSSLHDVKNSLIGLASAGVRDPDTGMIRLPLLQALLTAGSQASLDSDGSGSGSLTFADLRKAINPDLMQPATVASGTATTSPDGSQGIFIKTGTRSGKDVGYLIPQPLWSYLQRPNVSPDGWDTDFGTPITGAIPFLQVKNGNIHHMLVQLFWRDGLILDQDALDANGQPQIQRLATGLDYLRTLGPPAVAISPKLPVWVQAKTALFSTPSTSQAVAHVGQYFPLTLLSDTTWKSGILWYHVRWKVANQTSSGWIPAVALGFNAPNGGTVESSFDVLSPSLASYLAGIGSNAGAIVYDVTRHSYYSYNADTQFMMASSMKVPIMLTFLNMTEQQNREPSDSEMQLLTTMIENSNNDSASALYFNELSSADSVDSYMQQLGITDFSANSGSWGYSLISPRSMVNLLTLLYTGKILTAQDRQLAFSLMEQVEPDQQVGVGDTAPQGATVALKDGWVPAPDGSWLMNSSGIVTKGKETYIISVYTTEQSSLDAGQAITRRVCGTMASILS